MTDLIKVVLNGGEKGMVFNVSEQEFIELKKEEELIGDRCFEVRKEDGKWEEVRLRDIKLQQ